MINPQLRIVLIDDDRLWADTLAEYLRRKGYTVQTAPDGARGLALLENGEVALALVDGHMPDMEGLDLLRRLRQRRQPPAVLMVSGDDDPSLRTRALAEGAQGFVAKTTAPRLLLRMVRQALALRAGPHWLPVPHRPGRYLPVLISPRRS
jgi:DNA-binding response OmpR family regulator